MTSPTERFCRDLTAGLAALGTSVAAVSPGSRNAVILLALAAESGIDTTVHHDERSAAFFALGAAKATRRPAILACTSGTAAAHYYPAVIEARQARIPLIVLTADRPPEVREAGAPQMIDQIKLYGAAAKWFWDVGVPDETTASRAADIALRAWVAAVESPPGPVHINIPMREPLVTGPMPPASSRPPLPAVGVAELTASDQERFAGEVAGRRSLLVAGGRPPTGFGHNAARFAATLGIPVLADPQARFPSPHVLGHGDLLAAAGYLESVSPELVIRTGSLPTSKPLWRWLESSGVPQIYLDDGSWRDPLAAATSVYRADPGTVLGALAAGTAPAPEEWLERWRGADAAAAVAVAESLATEDFPNEPAIARTLYRSVAPGSIIYSGSSMPIRDLDAMAGLPREGVEVMANRGANGIDGLISAAGGAARSTKRNVVVHAGDLSVIHDSGALGTLVRLGLPVTVVAVDNDGGGIFHFLPHADPGLVAPEQFERVFAAPHGRDLTAIAAAYGLRSGDATSAADLQAAVANPPQAPQLIRIRTNRADNVAVHERITAAVRRRLDV